MLGSGSHETPSASRVDEEQRDAVGPPRCERGRGSSRPSARTARAASSRSRRSRHRVAYAEPVMASDASEPSRSSTAGMTTRSPAAISGAVTLAASSVPAERMTSAATRDGVEVGTRHEEASHLLVDRIEVEEAPTAAAELRRDRDPQPAEVGHLLPVLRRVADVAGFDARGRTPTGSGCRKNSLADCWSRSWSSSRVRSIAMSRAALSRESECAGGDDHPLDL